MILVAVESKINTTKKKVEGGGVLACIPATYLSQLNACVPKIGGNTYWSHNRTESDD